jgi:hypothetical protein
MFASMLVNTTKRPSESRMMNELYQQGSRSPKRIFFVTSPVDPVKLMKRLARKLGF